MDHRTELERVWPEALARWPGIGLEFDRFCEHARARVPDAEALASRNVVDLVLACACADGDTTALRHFDRAVLPAAERPVRRIESSDAFVEEVLQALRVRLLVASEAPPRISEYAGRGPLTAWVSVAAVRLALNSLRAAARADRFSDERWATALVLPETGDPEHEHLKARYATELKDALGRACRSLTDRERAVLRMYLVGGLNIDKIGKVYGVHRGTVARWINKSKETIAERTRQVLTDDFAIPTEDLESLDRLARSQLELSLAQLL